MSRCLLAVLRSLSLLLVSAGVGAAIAGAPPGKGFIACPKWDYGWVGTYQSAAVKFLWTQQVKNNACSVEITGTCVASGAINYDNPNIYVCPARFGGGVGCFNGDTNANATGRDGLTHTAPIIANEGSVSPASDKWHCAVSFPSNGTNTFKAIGKCPNCVGNPANPSTGNKFLEETDFEIPGEGGLMFKRFHNSAGWGYATMGLNWSHTWSRKVFIAGTDEAHAERPDGKVFVFTLVGGAWVGDPDVPETLVGSNGVGWTLTTRDDEVETYNADGTLASVKTRNGRVTTLAYSDGTASSQFNENSSEQHVTPGSLVSVTDFRGRKLTFGYDNDTQLVRMTDPAGNWASPDSSDTSDRCEYGTGGVAWRSAFSPRNSSVRQYG